MIIRNILISVCATAMLSACAKNRPELDPNEPRFRIGEVIISPSAETGSYEMAADLKRQLVRASNQCMSRLPGDLPVSDLEIELTHYNHLQPSGIFFPGRSKVHGNVVFASQASKKGYRFKLTDHPEANWRKQWASDSATFFGPQMTRDRLAHGVTSIILQRLYPECRGHGQVQQGRTYIQRAASEQPSHQPTPAVRAVQPDQVATPTRQIYRPEALSNVTSTEVMPERKRVYDGTPTPPAPQRF